MSALLQAAGLTVRYGRHVALEDVSFEVPAGEIVAVVGPNGAGKTTLFKAALGAATPTLGTIESAPTAYVPQSDAEQLHYPLTALDVALMGGYRRRAFWQPLGPGAAPRGPGPARAGRARRAGPRPVRRALGRPAPARPARPGPALAAAAAAARRAAERRRRDHPGGRRRPARGAAARGPLDPRLDARPDAGPPHLDPHAVPQPARGGLRPDRARRSPPRCCASVRGLAPGRRAAPRRAARADRRRGTRPRRGRRVSHLLHAAGRAVRARPDAARAARAGGRRSRLGRGRLPGRAARPVVHRRVAGPHRAPRPGAGLRARRLAAARRGGAGRGHRADRAAGPARRPDHRRHRDGRGLRRPVPARRDPAGRPGPPHPQPGRLPVRRRPGQQPVRRAGHDRARAADRRRAVARLPGGARDVVRPGLRRDAGLPAAGGRRAPPRPSWRRRWSCR